MDRHEQITQFIRDYWGQRAYPPSIRDIAAGTGLSRAMVHRALYDLRALGVLTWTEGQYRTLRLTDAQGANHD